MALQYRTKGFVYKKRDRGEADRIFTIFSYDFGKIDIWARGIRKIDSKLKSGIDIFFLSEIEFVQGRKKTLTDAVIINKFSDIINNSEKFAVARKIAKVLDDFVKGEEHDKEIFNLIVKIFEKLNCLASQCHCEEAELVEADEAIQSNSTNSVLPRSPSTSLGVARNDNEAGKLQLLFLLFLWNFFAILGYAPQLLNCAHCHGKLSENELYFSNKDGGAICNFCFDKESKNYPERSRRINSDIIKILRIILKNDFDTLIKLKINLSTQKELVNISKNYYLYLLSSHSFKK